MLADAFDQHFIHEGQTMPSKEERLIDAILCRKDDEVKSLLSTGFMGGKVSPNTSSMTNGHPALVLATSSDRYNIFAMLLSTPGIDVNKADKDGMTALHTLCDNYTESSSKAFRLLLASPGINLNKTLKKREHTETALSILSHRMNPQAPGAMTVLLNFPGVDINTGNPLFNTLHVLNRYYENLEDPNWNTAARQATSKEWEGVVLSMLAKTELDVNTNTMPYGGYKTSPLLYCSSNHPKLAPLVPVLLEIKRLNVNELVHHSSRSDSSYSTALHESIKYKKKQAMKYLIASSRIDVNVTDSEGDNPLRMAIAVEDEEAVRDLLGVRGIDVNKANKNGNTALHAASNMNAGNIVKHLLGVKALEINKQDKDGYTALHHACSKNNDEAVLRLSADKKINLNQTEREGFTPLMLAASKGHLQSVKLLVHAGADVSIYDKTGNASYYAEKAGHSGVVEYLKTVKSEQDEKKFKQEADNKRHLEIQARNNQEHLETLEREKRIKARELEKRREQEAHDEQVTKERSKKENERNDFIKKLAAISLIKINKNNVESLFTKYQELEDMALTLRNAEYFSSRGNYYYHLASEEKSSTRKEVFYHKALKDLRQVLDYYPFNDGVVAKIEEIECALKEKQKSTLPSSLPSNGSTSQKLFSPVKREDLSADELEKLAAIKEQLRLKQEAQRTGARFN